MSACKHKVSGSFHSPPGGLFTFPSRYFSSIGHWVVFRLGGWSPLLPTGFLVSRGTPDPSHNRPAFVYRHLTFSVAPSHALRLASRLSWMSTTPEVLLPPVWPLPLSLATTRGISVDFSSSPYLDVSVQAVPHIRLFCSTYVTHAFPCVGFPIRISADYRSFAAPRSFSQLVTSFIGSQCQGIPLVLFFT